MIGACGTGRCVGKEEPRAGGRRTKEGRIYAGMGYERGDPVGVSGLLLRGDCDATAGRQTNNRAGIFPAKFLLAASAVSMASQKVQYDNGDFYEGELDEEFQRHGRGKYVYANGSISTPARPYSCRRRIRGSVSAE